MDKTQYIINLFNDIKDGVQFDSDVVALETLLSKMLDIDTLESFNNWKYLILKYDISKLDRDIDFLPLVKSYPNKLLKKVGFTTFFNYMNGFPKDKMQYIYQYLFNVYEPSSYIYQSLDYYIKKHNYQDEKKLIQVFLEKKLDFFKGSFDQTEFIKRIILMHLSSNKISLPFIQELIEFVEDKKDKAVLKTLMIDYF